MKRLLLLLALASASCGSESILSPTTEAHTKAAPTGADFAAADEVPDCALFEKHARRVLSTAPGAFTVRMDYETALPGAYWKAVNLATGGLLYRSDFGDIEIRVPPGTYAIGVWVEAQADRLYSCHVGTLSVVVPAAVPEPGMETGGVLSDGAWLAPSGQEIMFWSGTLDTPSTVTAMVQWSLESCQGKTCPVHGLRRLRIRLDGAVVREVSIDGREDFVTQLEVAGAVGAGHVTVTGSHVTTLGGAGVPVWAALGYVRVTP